MSKFKFELKVAVMVAISGEAGFIKSRMESIDCKNQYMVHYKAADGRAVDNWFQESELKVVIPAPRPKAATKKRAVKKPTIPTV